MFDLMVWIVWLMGVVLLIIVKELEKDGIL